MFKTAVAETLIAVRFGPARLVVPPESVAEVRLPAFVLLSVTEPPLTLNDGAWKKLLLLTVSAPGLPTLTPPETARLPPLVTLTAPETPKVEFAAKTLLPLMFSEPGLVTVRAPVTVALPILTTLMPPLTFSDWSRYVPPAFFNTPPLPTLTLLEAERLPPDPTFAVPAMLIKVV